MKGGAAMSRAYRWPLFLLAILLLPLLRAAPESRSSRASAARAEPERTELASTGWARLKGKVTYDGAPPELDDFTESMAGNKDKDYCLKADTENPTWIVDDHKGVANVVIWVRPPKGKYFAIPDDLKKRRDVVKMDQPYCAFKPHGVVLFPSYWEPRTASQEPTGQVFEILNSAPVAHNILWSGTPVVNSGENVLIPPRKDDKPSKRVVPVHTGRTGREELIHINCNLHLWMRGWAWAFEHPYVALTKKDGAFDIPKLPAGAEMSLIAWHEGATPQWLLPERRGKRQGVSLPPLKAGEVRTFDFKVRKK
jgi:hypothetical protein